MTNSNIYVHPAFQRLFDEMVPDIRMLPVERPELNFEILGYAPDDFGGDAA
jgi:hypothetical protein